MNGDDLSRCKDELEALREENRALRDASTSFGDLAERLSERLGQERRQNTADRRRVERGSPDRRVRT
jgi:hypothetical protein